MRLYLINPTNPLVSCVTAKKNRWNRYRIWKPLSLLVLARQTPPEWEVTILDENLRSIDYATLPRPDLVGITAFTSQAPRAYQIAAFFRSLGVPVVMGGIHATMCLDEVLGQVDSVVTKEAENVWPQVLKDAQAGKLQRHYDGGHVAVADFVPARQDLLPEGYAFGTIQTTRGCPLNCSFCSVTTFNGAQYRQRPVDDVVREFASIPEKRVLVVDDNLVGTRADHIARAKELFRALAKAKLGKEWIAQATINFSDDEELMALAWKAGCRGVFIGFESPTGDGLRELGKKFNLRDGRDFRASVRRIQRHAILVMGSFIIGLDIDDAGIGERVALAAKQYGVDSMNALFLTPLPGTRLWDQMKSEDRITLDTFPADWRFYTLTLPVARYQRLTSDAVMKEMADCNRIFYSLSGVMSRVWSCFWQWRKPLINLITNLSTRTNSQVETRSYVDFQKHLAARPARVARALEPSQDAVPAA
ncbi:MAG TPA: radical SAM protein [Polyangia bacterium]